MLKVIFYIIAGLMIISAIYSVTSKDLIRSIFVFFAALFLQAGLYVFAFADFLAVAQIMIYVGGVSVLLMFTVMLSGKRDLGGLSREMKVDILFKLGRLPLAMLCLAIFIAFFYLLKGLPFYDISDENQKDDFFLSADPTNVQMIGISLITEFLLPLESISIYLLAVLVGAAYLIRRRSLR